MLFNVFFMIVREFGLNVFIKGYYVVFEGEGVFDVCIINFVF